MCPSRIEGRGFAKQSASFPRSWGRFDAPPSRGAASLRQCTSTLHSKCKTRFPVDHFVGIYFALILQRVACLADARGHPLMEVVVSEPSPILFRAWSVPTVVAFLLIPLLPSSEIALPPLPPSDEFAASSTGIRFFVARKSFFGTNICKIELVCSEYSEGAERGGKAKAGIPEHEGRLRRASSLL